MRFCPSCSDPLITRKIGNTDKGVCSSEACDFVNWDNPIPVVAGLIQLGDNFVLARNSEWPKKQFSVITGFMEKGESPKESIVRELGEELGYSCASLSFIDHLKFPQMNQLIIAYNVRVKGLLSLGNEIAEVKVVSKEELLQYDFGRFQLTKEIIKSWARNENHT